MSKPTTAGLFAFNLQLFAIDSLPAVQSILEQVNLLERVFQAPLDANLAYALCADDEIFPNGIGETITKTRPALFPLSTAITPINPSGNTGIDNGLSNTFFVSEQYQLPINEYAMSTNTNIMQDRTLLSRTFLQNVYTLGENASRTLDGLCAQFTHTAYDSGNTFATAGISASTWLHVDNVYGFDTAFSSTNSPGLPTAVSSGNTASAQVIDHTNGSVKGTITISGILLDSPNTSTAFVNGLNYGASGFLVLSSTGGVTVAANDQVLASDGSFVDRTAGVYTRAGLTSSSTLTLQLVANAKAKLAARNIPPFSNGYYVCVVDPQLWPQLLADTAFNYASMGQLGEDGYFRNGIVNRALGIVFINSNMVPAYSIPSSVYKARHAVVIGRGMLIRGTFQGHIDAAQEARQMDNADIRFMDKVKAALITRAPLDRLQEQITQSWKWVGGFVCPTDVTSTNLIIPTTDAARYKRAVVIEVASL